MLLHAAVRQHVIRGYAERWPRLADCVAMAGDAAAGALLEELRRRVEVGAIPQIDQSLAVGTLTATWRGASWHVSGH